ncbi:hypothetical protein NQ176_g996 [Zarea fungicola]|uniref:Uncharacterized protein n=1 Tax=Zarea fungicola TaxID=93591 RepID=A0ACC1NX21_9HYPO|nr:hypothetical protein NQ176_g996 [Lecanicillium fungicola]
MLLTPEAIVGLVALILGVPSTIAVMWSWRGSITQRPTSPANDLSREERNMGISAVLPEDPNDTSDPVWSNTESRLERSQEDQ